MVCFLFVVLYCTLQFELWVVIYVGCYYLVGDCFRMVLVVWFDLCCLLFYVVSVWMFGFRIVVLVGWFCWKLLVIVL